MLAALDLKRQFIGCEMGDVEFKQAQQRLADYAK